VVVIWDLEGDEDGNYVHIVVEHGISQDEVDDVVSDPANPTVDSGSSGRPITFGPTRTGRYIAVVWELVTDDPYTIKPVTAYETPEPRAARPTGRRRKRRKR
jgi:hypothetical protein